MRPGNLITGALMIKLLAAAVKRSRETDRDIFDMLKEYSDSRRQRKSGGNNETPPHAGASKAKNFFENNRKKTAPQSRQHPVYSGVVRPVPAKPDTDVPDYFTPYEGADMTCAEAREAGFEFVLSKNYYGVDYLPGMHVDPKRRCGEITYTYESRRGCWGRGASACIITGWHGSAEIVKIPRSINGRPVVKIEKEAFKTGFKKGRYKYHNIRKIYLPDSVLEIDDNAFEHCGAEYARLSKNLVRIGKEAFYGCSSLKKIYLGGARIIEECAFSYCGSLRSVRLPDRVEKLGRFAFFHSEIEKLYWNIIVKADGGVLRETPYIDNHDVILLGDCLQRCFIKGGDEIIVDSPCIGRIGEYCFSCSDVKKITLSDNIQVIETRAFHFTSKNEIEIYAPGAFKFGESCFWGQKVTVSEEFRRSEGSEKGFLYIEPYSFDSTEMEQDYIVGRREKPWICVTVRNILARVELRPSEINDGIPRGILTLSEDGSTLAMDDRVECTAARYIPNFGAKKLILSRSLHTLRSFASVQDFEEIVFFRIPDIHERTKFHPKKSVLLRFRVYSYKDEKTVDSALLLYLPKDVTSPEAQRLYGLYDKCLIYFREYDREILNLVSSYSARFTIARLRLEGGLDLDSEARERYENFLLTHKRKAEFTAKKHGDTALLSLLEKLSEKNTYPKGDFSK